MAGRARHVAGMAAVDALDAMSSQKGAAGRAARGAQIPTFDPAKTPRSGDGDEDEDADLQDFEAGQPVELPIDGVLDLHHFSPMDAPDLVATYLDACRARGIRQVRIIHGKGTGALRQSVRAVLLRHPAVSAFETADAMAGGWGATLVTLADG